MKIALILASLFTTQLSFAKNLPFGSSKQFSTTVVLPNAPLNSATFKCPPGTVPSPNGPRDCIDKEDAPIKNAQ